MKLTIKRGFKFNMLTVLCEIEPAILPSGQKNRVFRCKCDCGNEKDVRLAHLTHNKIKSCGCLIPQHGYSKSKLYNTWRGMLNRTRNKTYIDSHRYLERGISVCKEWEKFTVFKKWALSNGFKDGLQIDRIDNNGDYTPDNCRFVTQFENMNNREVTTMVVYENKEQPLLPLLRDIGKIDNSPAIRGRLRRGWDHEKAINTPIRQGNYARR